MCDEIDFFSLLSHTGIPVHALCFLSRCSDPLTLLSPSSMPAPRPRKLRSHQPIAGWSSACKAPDEAESRCILWNAACWQTTVLNSSICPHPISSPRSEDPPPLLRGRETEEKFKGSLSQLFFPLLWRCSVTEGSALLRFSAVLQYWWGSKAAQIIQGCLQEWLKSCYLCTARTGDLRRMGLLSGTAWRACMFPWGPRQVPCLLSSEIGSFHHRKWDHVCKDLERRC